jgi:diguanylate cyclase (GGDEF)-like protein
MNLKRWLITAIFFILLFCPVVLLSFFAYTVVHQMILLAALLITGWAAFYVGHLVNERLRLSQEVFRQAYELKKSNETVQSYSAMDGNTHVYHSKLLDSRLTEECDRARRYHRPLSTLLVTVDAFSGLTERHGATIMGLITQHVAQFLKEHTRLVDIIIRRGEDSFVTILPETARNQARIVAERIRFAIEKNVFQIEGREIKVTVSIGVVSFDPTIYQGKNELLAALEKTLNEARKSGSSQIAVLAGEIE